MEFIDGVPANDVAGIKKLGYQPKDVRKSSLRHFVSTRVY